MNQRNNAYRAATIGSVLCILGALLVSTGCMVGPNYKRPPAPVPLAFKEAPPDGWKEAKPNDDTHSPI